MKITYSLILLFTGLSLFAQNSIIAHRGASYLAPENTIAAAKLAWDLGTDAVVVNVQLSKDNRLMVIHDKDTKRTCSNKKNLEIAKNPSMLLRDLDAGKSKGEEFKGERIPFLSEIIETIPDGKTLFVDIKYGKEAIPALERSLEKSGKQEQLAFICINWPTIVATQEAFPGNKCYWLSSSKPGLKKKMIQVKQKGLAGVILKHSIIDSEIITAAKENELEVLSWTVDDAKEAKKLFELGVTSITTNRPQWLREELSK